LSPGVVDVFVERKCKGGKTRNRTIALEINAYPATTFVENTVPQTFNKTTMLYVMKL